MRPPQIAVSHFNPVKEFMSRQELGRIRHSEFAAEMNRRKVERAGQFGIGTTQGIDVESAVRWLSNVLC